MGLLWMLAAGVKWIGQDLAIIAPLIYAPKLLPGLCFLAPALLGWHGKNRPLMAAGLLSSFLWFIPVLEWRLPGRPPVASGKTLRVLTCNRGQNDGHTLGGWMLHRRPDLMVIQDAFAPHAYVAEAIENSIFPHHRRVGEHVLLSQHPILSAVPADRENMIRRGSNWHYMPAVRFVIDWEGREIVVWSIHIRSPRDQFRSYRGLLKQHIGLPVGSSDLEAIKSEEWGGSYWPEQRLSVEALLELIHADTQPTLVLGDWNVPDTGPRYWDITRQLTDAHREVGTGYGYTFPGDLQWWAAFNRPWLRIDYIFSDRHWTPIRCEVEPDSGGSQHFALFGELELRE